MEFLEKKIIQIRRDIHQHPELGFDIHRTAKIAAEECEKLGFKIKTHIGQTGVLCDLKAPEQNKNTKTIALRADLDALPIQEESDFDFKSIYAQKAHLCGHDAHTAMLIGAAHLISQNKKNLKHNIRLIFQPHEEGLPGGAPLMIKDGALENVSEIYGLHVWPDLITGELGVLAGPIMAQADKFEIEIIGKASHASQPHKSIDPIIIASQIILSAQTLISRSINPLESAVLSICEFHAGSAFNQIPQTAKLSGTVRTYDKKTQATIKLLFKKIIQNTTKAFGAKYNFNYQNGFPALNNNKILVSKVLDLDLNFAKIIKNHKPSLAGEDFAYYAQKVPACFIHLGCTNPRDNKTNHYSLHHPSFNLDENCLIIGAKLLASLAFSNYIAN